MYYLTVTGFTRSDAITACDSGFHMFPKPGQTQPSQKWAYVKAVKVDGVPSLVTSGFYPE